MRLGVPHRPMARIQNLEVLLAPHELVRGRTACRSDRHLDALMAWGSTEDPLLLQAVGAGRHPLGCRPGFGRLSIGSTAVVGNAPRP